MPRQSANAPSSPAKPLDAFQGQRQLSSPTGAPHVVQRGPRSGVDDLIHDTVERVVRHHLQLQRDAECGADWIDQRHSPLGRKVHCQLWRAGVLPGRKLRRRVLVRRRDLDAYIEAHGLPAPVVAATAANDAEAACFARVGWKRVSQ